MPWIYPTRVRICSRRNRQKVDWFLALTKVIGVRINGMQTLWHPSPSLGHPGVILNCCQRSGTRAENGDVFFLIILTVGNDWTQLWHYMRVVTYRRGFPLWMGGRLDPPERLARAKGSDPREGSDWIRKIYCPFAAPLSAKFSVHYPPNLFRFLFIPINFSSKKWINSFQKINLHGHTFQGTKPNTLQPESKSRVGEEKWKNPQFFKKKPLMRTSQSCFWKRKNPTRKSYKNLFERLLSENLRLFGNSFVLTEAEGRTPLHSKWGTYENFARIAWVDKSLWLVKMVFGKKHLFVFFNPQERKKSILSIDFFL